LNEIKVSIKP